MSDIYKDYASNTFFKEREFVCKCGKCSSAYVDAELIKLLTKAREKANIPFVITSGCRCATHNKKEGGKPNSDHLYNPEINDVCCGVDIRCIDDRSRFIIIDALLASGINRIGVGKGFVHAGLPKRNSENSIWIY